MGLSRLSYVRDVLRKEVDINVNLAVVRVRNVTRDKQRPNDE